ncbi:hypothetical protein AB0N87_28340 [Streptomyces sp. NPDC093228]|uniref:hypothetical protein n=1 Tax=Streptomyces sp. NPDC093228 TaxID=3155070 RepID=UPI00342D0E43
MDANTLTAIVNELTADGWHGIDQRESDPDVLIVKALHRHRLKANGSAMTAVRQALWDRRPAPEPGPEPQPEPAVDDLGLPVPTVEELAQEAAYMVDVFFAFALASLPDALWAFTNDDIQCDALPADIRRTCFRAGMTVAAAHGVPGSAPNMRQVVNALILRMAKDGRLKRS